jgi:hypothetical protein
MGHRSDVVRTQIEGFRQRIQFHSGDLQINPMGHGIDLDARQ